MTTEDDEDPPYEVTPRTGALLRVAAVMLRDGLDDRGGYHDGREPVSDLYPRIVLQHADDEWWRRMAGCYDAVIRSLDAGEDPDPQCTAEEVALWNTINRARRLLSYRIADVDISGWRIDWAPIEALPAEDLDYDWERARDLLFGDADFLALYQPEFDGIEDPDDAINKAQGIGENLIPAHWFDPFYAPG